MTAGEKPAGGDPTGLRVRVLKVVQADGEELVRETVYCPRKDLSLEVDTCTQCGLLRGIGLDEKEGTPVVECVPNEATGEDARATPVSHIMTRAVVAVAPDVGVGKVRAALAERSWGIIPVVDGCGHPLGMISSQDLIRRRRLSRREVTAEQVMTPIDSGIPEGASVAHAAALIAHEQVKGYPVVDHERRVVGLVTSLDVAMWLAKREGYLVVSSRKGGVMRASGALDASGEPAAELPVEGPGPDK